MAKCAARSSGEFGLQVSAIVRAPRRRAAGDGGHSKRRAPARSNAENNVLLGWFAQSHFVAPCLRIILADFGGRAESLVASRDDELHRARIGVEGGWAFDGVERGDATAGSGADVDEASAVA